MRWLSLLAFLLAVGTTSPTSAVAQEGASTASYPFEEWRALLLRDVPLTAAQRAKVDTIARATHLRMRALQPVMAAAPDSARARRLRELRHRQAEAIRAILTAEQRRIFQRNHDAWAARRP